MPTTYDTFIHGLDDRVNPPSGLPVTPAIQPVAAVAHATEFLIPPLADRAFAAGFGDSTAFAPLVGQTGTVFLAQGIVLDEVAAWFWIKPLKPFGAGEDIFYGLTLRPVGALNLIASASTPPANMSATPARLSVFQGSTTNIGLTGALDVWDNHGADRGVNGRWDGPFFKPAGLAVQLAGAIQQTIMQAVFKWVEIPNPR